MGPNGMRMAEKIERESVKDIEDQGPDQVTQHSSQLLSASETVLKTVVAKVWPCLCDYLEIELAVITSLAEDSLQHFVYEQKASFVKLFTHSFIHSFIYLIFNKLFIYWLYWVFIAT